jgi:hypothetical protein
MHDYFLIYGDRKAFRHDGTKQCWITEVGNFGTNIDPEYYCVFHAPLMKEPVDRDDWGVATRGDVQASLLKQLLDAWNEDNKQSEKNSSDKNTIQSFILPWIHCGDVGFGKDISGGDDLGFDEYIFSGDVLFHFATFNGDAGFGSATFRGNAGFYSATFNGTAAFATVTFNGLALFDSATFNGDALFDSSTFNGGTGFDSAIFSRNAGFGSATFNGDANFRSTTFNRDAWFVSTTFKKVARFRSATFNGDALFHSTTFNEDTGFDSATFSRNAGFGSATFNGDAKFNNTQFHSVTDFTNGLFKIAPQFHNAILHQGTDFRGRVFEDRSTRGAPPAYRTLKLAMSKVSSGKEEDDFYALELESLMRQPETRISVRFFSYLYRVFSDYGRSFVRPLWWLLGMTVVFMGFYSAILQTNTKLTEQYSCVIQFTVEQLVRPFNIWTMKGAEEISKLASDYVLLLQSLSTLQSLFSITFIALFLLAVRRQFKLG